MRVTSEPKTAANHAAFVALSEGCDTLRSCIHRYPHDTMAYEEMLAPRRAAGSGYSTKLYTLGVTPCKLLTICQQMWRNNQEDLNHQQCFDSKSSRRAHASFKSYAYKQ
jgi:hypothetical protein